MLYCLVTAFLLCTACGFAQEKKFELVKIDFQGNQSFSSAMLKDLIASVETPSWISKFLHSFTSLGKAPEYFDSLNIEKDLRSLHDFYTANGFFRASITPSWETDSAHYELTLRYTINEGKPTRVHNITVFGLKNVTGELKSETDNLLAPDTTKRFSQSNLKGAIDNVQNLLGNNGFMLIRYDSTLVIQDTSSATTDLHIYFNSGKQYTIGSLTIDKKGPGADKVENELIERIVGIKEHDRYSYEKIRLSQVRLYRTGLFSSVTLVPILSDTVGSVAPLLLTGDISKLTELSPEIIMNNQSGTFNVGLGAGIARKNFLGDARKLTINGSFGISDIVRANPSNIMKTFSLQDSTVLGYFEGSVKIEQPYVFNRPIFSTIEGYLRINKDVVSNKRTLGGKLSFEFEMPNYTFVNFLTAYYSFEVVDEIFPHRGQLSESLSILGGEAKAYKANDPIYPTKGYNLGFLFEEANLLNDVLGRIVHHTFTGALFYRTTISAAYYLPGSARNDLSAYGAKLKIGYIQAYEGEEIDIPSVKKFTVGGSNSLRAWKSRELAPQEMKQMQQLDSTLTIVGGTFLFEGSLEYRHKFTPEVGAVLFTDFGNTWLGYRAFQPDEIAVASGFGLRYYSAFAPFRVDFAVKSYDPNYRKNFFKKTFFKELFEFQIGIGEAF